MIRTKRWFWLVSLVAMTVVAVGFGCSTGEAAREATASPEAGAASPAGSPAKGDSEKREVALLAGGCFWCVESAFDDVPGVITAVSGFTGGAEPNPTYQEVSAGGTGHYESVQVTFDPSRISYAQILDTYWRQIDPTDAGGQFADRGTQYRAAIFVADEGQRKIAEASKAFLEKSGWFDKPIATTILPAGPFYPAEEYHQDYHAKHPIEYKAYKWASGRGPFIEKVWKDKPPILAEAAASDETYRRPTADVLRTRLTPIQYRVTQESATEPPFHNEYWDTHEAGIYVDVVTGEPLFSSADKFDSGTGWPSFTRPLEPSNVVEQSGDPLGMFGTEVRSRHGDSHLGHVFGDGPPPTGRRYCINSAALRFIPEVQLEKSGYSQYARSFQAVSKP